MDGYHRRTGWDVGRGVAADIDPHYPGMEVWGFNGLYSVAGVQVSESAPWPNLPIWWNGDLHAELLNEEKIDEWNLQTEVTSRVLTVYHYGASAGTFVMCLLFTAT